MSEEGKASVRISFVFKTSNICHSQKSEVFNNKVQAHESLRSYVFIDYLQ